MADEVTDLTRGVYRRLYSGFTTGQRINKISLNAEAWFWRILAIGDRRGLVPADPKTLHSVTVGLRVGVGIKSVARWVEEMVEVGLLQRVGEKLQIVDFERFQPKTVLNGERPAIPNAIRREVLSVGYCLLCGSTQELSVDHIQPVSKGGSNDRHNLQCLCLPCNIKKSNRWEVQAS